MNQVLSERPQRLPLAQACRALSLNRSSVYTRRNRFDLVSVLPDYCPPEVSIHALYPPNRHLTLKIRLLIDFLADRFGDPPYWDLVS